MASAVLDGHISEWGPCVANHDQDREVLHAVPSDRNREISCDREIQNTCYCEQSTHDRIHRRLSILTVSSRKKLAKPRLRVKLWRKDEITEGDEGKARPTVGFDQTGYRARRLHQPFSSGGCRHCGRGSHPPGGRQQARYQPAGGIARDLPESYRRTTTLGGVPASRLPPRSRKETTNCGEDHHKAVLSSKAVPPSKAQSKCEGQLLAIVGSSIPPGTSLRCRRRQKRAKSKVAAGATGEVIVESTALMANSLQGGGGGRWASRLIRN